jgi:ferredoxin, 2Fe-2S
MQATWHLPDGRIITADVREDQSLMEAAVALGLPRITGDCGGNLSCATCHVAVDAAWVSATGTPNAFEEAMLDVAEADRTPTSRLSCQLRMTAALDGVILHIPT